MIWQLLQVGRLQDTRSFWLEKMYFEHIAWCRHHMLGPELNLANPEDITLPRCVDDGPGILHILRTPLGLMLGNRRLPADLLFDAAETR
jgi:hypothetical protein